MLATWEHRGKNVMVRCTPCTVRAFPLLSNRAPKHQYHNSSSNFIEDDKTPTMPQGLTRGNRGKTNTKTLQQYHHRPRGNTISNGSTHHDKQWCRAVHLITRRSNACAEIHRASRTGHVAQTYMRYAGGEIMRSL